MNTSHWTLAVVWAALAGVALGGGSRLSIEPGPGGLGELKLGDTNILADGEFKVSRAVFEKADGEKYTPGDKPTVTVGRDKHPGVTVTFPWGEVSCAYQGGTDRLDLIVSVTSAGILIRPRSL